MLVAAAALLAPALSSAQERGARLSWVRGEGADACPDEGVILRAVVERLGPETFRGPVAQRIEALVSRDGDHWRLRIFVRSPEGARVGQRELTDRSPTCAEIAATGALAIALSIDPDAPVSTSVPAEPVPGARRSGQRQVIEVRSPLHGTGATLRMTGVVGMLPSIAPGIGLGVRALRYERFVLEATAMIVPAVHVDVDAIRFGFGLTTLGLAGCGVITRSRAAEVAFCGGLLGGLVHATVAGSERSRPAEVPWLALTLGARLSVPILGPLTAELALDAVTPITHLQFAGERQDALVFQQPLLGAVGSVGLGLTFR